jgi:hypothetical protein
VSFDPNGPATLHVSDSVFYNNADHGLVIRPRANGFTNAHIRNSRFERNQSGLLADGKNSVIGINVNISDSMFTENAENGIAASSIAGQAPVAVLVISSHISGNFINGLSASSASGEGNPTLETPRS